jgi:hypothetical protein
MQTGLGVALIVSSCVVLLIVSFALRPRAPVVLSLGLASLAGASLAGGALLVQPHASAADWAIAVPAMAALAPAHIRILLGPFGPLKDPGLLAEDAQDA